MLGFETGVACGNKTLTLSVNNFFTCYLIFLICYFWIIGYCCLNFEYDLELLILELYGTYHSVQSKLYAHSGFIFIGGKC